MLPGIVIATLRGLLPRAITDKKLLMIGAVAMVIGAVLIGSATDAQSLYVGRLATGIRGTIFNVVLTKMGSDWCDGREIVTASKRTSTSVR